jgi:hypothetical protein
MQTSEYSDEATRKGKRAAFPTNVGQIKVSPIIITSAPNPNTPAAAIGLSLKKTGVNS